MVHLTSLAEECVGLRKQNKTLRLEKSLQPFCSLYFLSLCSQSIQCLSHEIKLLQPLSIIESKHNRNFKLIFKGPVLFWVKRIGQEAKSPFCKGNERRPVRERPRKIEVFYQIVTSSVLKTFNLVKSCPEKQKLLEVASTEKSCSKSQKLLKKLPSMDMPRWSSNFLGVVIGDLVFLRGCSSEIN